MMDIEFTYIKYILPGNVNIVLTSRPDSYSEGRVNDFIEEHDPCVRFQMTDDTMRRLRAEKIPFHWLSWFPSRKLPLEIAYFNISLLNYYVIGHRNGSIAKTIWLHCDSSSMRAPTFLGLYLYCYYPEKIVSIIEDSTYTCAYRRKSCPKDYAETSMRLDPGIEDMVKHWQEGGEERAHNYIANRRTDEPNL